MIASNYCILLSLRPSSGDLHEYQSIACVSSGVSFFFVSFASLTQPFDCRQFVRLRKMRVPHHHLQGLMSEQLRYCVQIYASHHKAVGM